ncbi:MAG: LuxR C-terminal-related transcriptional regulator [Vicinamibacteria bacterium]
MLGWAAAGKSNAQIATIVGASPRTIAKHLERVYEKSASSRAPLRRCARCGARVSSVSPPLRAGARGAAPRRSPRRAARPTGRSVRRR